MSDPEAWLTARGAVGGTEPAEDIIRRLRDGCSGPDDYTGESEIVRAILESNGVRTAESIRAGEAEVASGTPFVTLNGVISKRD